MYSIIVIGGGIAGLSAAYYLHKNTAAQGSPVSITLLEREPYWGGKIITDRLDGFVIEGGPDTFLATKPWGVGLCRELGLSERLQGTNPHHKNTYVLHRKHLSPLPDGLTMMIPTRFAPMARTRLLSPIAKARMGMDFLLPPRPLNGDESLGTFVSRRLGRTAYERLIEAQHPDDFTRHLLDLDPPAVCNAARLQRQALRNPPKSPEEFLDTLLQQGLAGTVTQLEDMIELL